MEDLNPSAPQPTKQTGVILPQRARKDSEMEGIDPGILALMKDNNGDKDNTLLVVLLLLFGGGLGGVGRRDGEGVRDAASLADINALQNSLQNCMVANTNAVSERTLDITRDQASNALRNESGQNLIQTQMAMASNQALMGQKDITAGIADCCCQNLIQQKETQNRIDKCCCETQNSILMQTQVLSTQICQDGDKTRALITQGEIDRLQAQLTDQKVANSNLMQTTHLDASIRAACCQPCQPCHPPHPWHPAGNGNGNGAPA